jgi:membrane associated rhomboid family serine protease
MMALVPLGSELERIMGSVRLLYVTILLATSNAIFHVLIALLVAHNPFLTNNYLMNECAIGFSGVLFSMIVIETSLSGVQSRRLANKYCCCQGIHLTMQFNILIITVVFLR